MEEYQVVSVCMRKCCNNFYIPGNMVNSDLGLFLADEFKLDLAKATEAVK
jgi:hypothetical protein